MENEEHLFKDCSVISRVWMESCLGIQSQGIFYIPLRDWIANFLKKLWKEEGRDGKR